MTSLKGKTLFISGASRGIGLAIALRAARDGANVAIAAKTTEAHPKLPGTIHSAAAELEAAGGRALSCFCHVIAPGAFRYLAGNPAVLVQDLAHVADAEPLARAIRLIENARAAVLAGMEIGGCPAGPS